MKESTTSSRQWTVGEISKRADGSWWKCISAADKPWIDRKGKEHWHVEFERVTKASVRGEIK